MKRWWQGVGFGIGITMLYLFMMEVGGVGRWESLEVNHWTAVGIACAVFLMIIHNPWINDKKD